MIPWHVDLIDYKPKLSLCISAYNEECNIRDCINSILSSDGFAAHEILLLNNGSKDKTESIMREFSAIGNIKIISFQINTTLQYARNYLLEKSVGEFAVFLDADGRIAKNYIDILLKNISNDFSIYSGPVIEQATKTNLMYELHYKSLIESDSNFLIGANFTINRKKALKVGGFPNITRSRGDESPLIEIMKRAGCKQKFIDDLIASNHFINNSYDFLRSAFFEGQNAFLCIKYFKQPLLLKLLYKSMLLTGTILLVLGLILSLAKLIFIGIILIALKLFKNKFYWKSVIKNFFSYIFNGSLLVLPLIYFHTIFHEVGFLISAIVRAKPNT